MTFLRRLPLLLAALCLGVPALAQSVTFSGYVRDAATGETLVGANLYAPDAETGTVTNAYGFFSLALPAATDSASVLVSYIGYEPQTLLFRSDARGPLDIALAPVQTELGTVDVVADRSDPLEDTQMSTASIPISRIKSLPALLGEVDVLKALQLLPGVQSGTEGTSGLYVRGGGPDQNLLLLDGAPVYNASHLFGFFSTFNADALKSVDLIKGGFPARYGGRLSSVLDLRMKEGNMKELAGEGAVGLVASRLTLEGPILKDRASFLVSGRRTYIDLLAAPFLPENEKAGYYFYDLNAKANAILGPRDRVYASLYAGQDRFSASVEDDFSRTEGGLDWGNLTTTLRWNHQFSGRLFANAAFLFSRYRFDVEALEERRGDDPATFAARYRSGIRDVGGRIDFDFVPSARHYVRFGGALTRHRYSPGAVTSRTDGAGGGLDLDGPIAASPAIDATEGVVYAEDDLRLSRALTVNLGLHASGFAVRDARFFSLQPRLATRLRIGEATAVRASYAAMKQYIHLLTNAGLGLPTDLWLPATAEVPPQTSHQIALGVTRTFGPRYEVSVEAYTKWMEDLTEYGEGASFFNTAFDDWESQLTSGSGRAYGVEVFLQKKTGRTTGWVGYTLAWSDRQFDALNGGARFPYRYDRRHDVSVVLNQRLSERVEFAATWVYGAGPAITLPVGRMPGFPDDPAFPGGFFYGYAVDDFGERGGFRMPAYHRLDVAINFHKETRWGERTLTLGAYNAYNRKNPFFVMLTNEYDGQTARPVFKQISLFPIIPAISYRFQF